MKLPDFVNQSNVDLTNRVSGFFGNEVKHDSLITGIEDLYLNTKKLHDNVVTMEGEVEKDTTQVRGDRVIVEELSDRVFDAGNAVEHAHNEVIEAKDRVLVAEANAINSANSASSDAAKAKLSEEFALNYSHDARGFANNALLSSEESHKYFDYSYALYEDLRKGQVYRGVWNPHTGAWPDHGDTNSAWDVILNENEEEFTWNGIKWFWGDRVVYVKETNTYSQIESGTGGGVTSVNGKKGAVTLKSIDVEAVPLDGSLPMTAYLNTVGVNLSGNEGYIVNNEGEAFVQSTKTFGSTLFGTATKNTYLVFKDNLHARKGTTDYKIYHEGYKPVYTAADVGALPITGGMITGKLDCTHTIHSHNDLRADGDIYAMGDATIEGELVALKGVSTVGGITIHGTGNIQAMPGGFLRCNTGSVMSMDGKDYAFTTASLDAHMCSNSFWNGRDWNKYDASKASMYAVVNQAGQFKLMASSATSTNPNELNPLLIDRVGNTYIGGGLEVTKDIKTIGSVDAGYVQVRNHGNPAFEMHDPGNSAAMIYKPQGTATIRFCQSNGAGGEATGYGTVDVHGFQTTNGRFASNYISSDRAWGGTGQNHFHGLPSNVNGNGTLYGMVGKQYNYPGHWSLENYSGVWVGTTNVNDVAHAFVSTDGGSYLRQWFLYNDGRMASPAGHYVHWSMTSDGILHGSAYGGYGSIVQWCIASFAPASDEKLKKNLKPTVKSALSDIAKVQFHSYEWKEDEVSPAGAKPVAIGVTAQEMEAIDSSYTRDIETFGDDAISVKTLDVTNVLALALKGIQELTEANAKLTERVAMLEASKLV